MSHFVAHLLVARLGLRRQQLNWSRINRNGSQSRGELLSEGWKEGGGKGRSTTTKHAVELHH